jgi:hypothetical protein
MKGGFSSCLAARAERRVPAIRALLEVGWNWLALTPMSCVVLAPLFILVRLLVHVYLGVRIVEVWPCSARRAGALHVLRRVAFLWRLLGGAGAAASRVLVLLRALVVLGEAPGRRPEGRSGDHLQHTCMAVKLLTSEALQVPPEDCELRPDLEASS